MTISPYRHLGAAPAATHSAVATVRTTQLEKLRGAAMDPGAYAFIAGGAAAAYLGSRSRNAALGGALAGAGAALLPHMNAQGGSPIPLLLAGSAALAGGLFLVGRS